MKRATVSGRANLLGMLMYVSVTTHPGVTGNEYRPKCGKALRLESKCRSGSLHMWMDVFEQVNTGKLCDCSLKRVTPERLGEDESLLIKRCTQGSFRAGTHRNAVPVLFLITGTPFRSFSAYSCKI